jgi:pimeloyl-ACP methyl ester carboxylesterase
MATKTHEDEIITLADGRRLGYAEYGDRRGTPFLYFHGTPGSRLAGRRLHEIASSHSTRVVAPDRPGYGFSDFKLERSILAWTDDVLELADFLDLERIAVWGASGGSPYALACALRIPDRVSTVVLESGLGPFHLMDAEAMAKLNPLNKAGSVFAARAPFCLTKGLAEIVGAAVRRFPNLFYSVFVATSSGSDKRRLNRPEVRERTLAISLEPFRSGGAGWAWEERILALPWGFELAEVRRPVRLYHGEEDIDVPVAMARAMERALPDCRATYYPGLGHQFEAEHVSRMFDEVLSEIAGDGE